MNHAAHPVTVQLPGGYQYDGRRCREAELRAVNGHDEAFLQQAAGMLSPAALTTALLARCVQRVGPCDDVNPQVVRSLSVGDREALLLHLRNLTLGRSMSCVVQCPAGDCGAKLDATVDIQDLLLGPYADFPAVHEAKLRQDGEECQVRFRLPTGADQEEVAEQGHTDPQAAAEMLVERCLETTQVLSPGLQAQLSRVMAQLDPQAEIELQLTCPDCGAEFSALLDAGTFLVQELTGNDDLLHREMHLLALCYHWSPADILAMPSPDRRRCVDILDEALAEEA